MDANETGGSILIVDDAPDNLRLLAWLLTERGYHVRTAQSGREALTSIQAAPPDLVLLDVKLPDLDGYEVCTRLKADAATRRVRRKRSGMTVEQLQFRKIFLNVLEGERHEQTASH